MTINDLRGVLKGRVLLPDDYGFEQAAAAWNLTVRQPVAAVAEAADADDVAAVAEAMPLDVRSWTCPCGAVHDRDINAAKNILAAGRAERLNASHSSGRDGASRPGGGQVRPPHQVASPSKQEATEVAA